MNAFSGSLKWLLCALALIAGQGGLTHAQGASAGPGAASPHANAAQNPVQRDGAGGGSADAPGEIRPVAGLYWCVAPSWSAGTINLRPDGTYQVNGNDAGRYTVRPGQVRFDGQLSSWNNGVARVEGNRLVFEWANNKGARQYFAYGKGG